MTSDYRVAIVVATFGDNTWQEDGDWAASLVVRDQTVIPPVCRIHLPNGTLVEARNEAARLISSDPAWEETEWLVFLDSDDELDPKFVETLLAYKGDADVLQTAVRGFKYNMGDVDGPGLKEWIEPVPVLHKQKFPLLRQNYLTIGSPIRLDLFQDIGGFDEWPVLEDWALWLKCLNAGAGFGELFEAVYYINDNHFRNVNPIIDDVARQIRATYARQASLDEQAHWEARQ